MKIRNFVCGIIAILSVFTGCEVLDNVENLDVTKLEISETKVDFGAEGGSKTMTVTAGKIWQVTYPEGVNWVSVTPETGEASAKAQEVTITVGPNTGYEQTAYLTFTTGLVEQTLEVFQAGSIARNYTDISKVRALKPAASGQTATLGEDVVVKGVVVSNKDFDNFTSGKTCYIQDATGGLQIFFSANHDFAFGDILEVDLSGATLKNYSASAEIDGLDLGKAVKVGTETVTPKVVSMTDFLANKFEGQYVEIDTPVQIVAADLSKTWVIGEAHTNINAEDAAGNKFVIRSGKYSEYGSKTVAQGSGRIKGIATVFNTTIQLVFAQESDWAGLTGERFSAQSGGGQGGSASSAEGLVVAASARAYLVKTASGYSYVYVGGDHSVKVGDNVKVNGTPGEYAGVPQIASPKTEVVSSGNTVTHPAPTVLSAAGVDSYSTVFGYVTITGKYVKSGNYHNIEISGATRTGSISYPKSVDESLNGKNVDLTGYFVGISGTSYFQVLMTDIKLSGSQGGSTEPDTPAEAKVVTVSEFLAAPVSTSVLYKVTGTITSIDEMSAQYNNATLSIADNTGNLYVYRMKPAGDAKIDALGLTVGDELTVIGNRGEYNGSSQMTNGKYSSHVDKATPSGPEVPDGATAASVVFSSKGYTNGQVVKDEIKLDDVVSVKFAKGGANNDPAYYDSGSAIRMYQNGSTLDVTAAGKTIISIELKFATNMWYLAPDCGQLSAEGAIRTWTGSSSAVKFTSTGADKDHRAYISAITVVYK